jgi:hypothetical protein
MAVGAPGAWRDAVAPGPAGGDELRAGLTINSVFINQAPWYIKNKE